MSSIEPKQLAAEFLTAFTTRQNSLVPPSSRDAGFDLARAYQVEAEFKRLREAAGRVPIGRKVGYANRAMWRVLKLESLVWAHMYDDTLRYAASNEAELNVGDFGSPKVEPEIVFKLKRPIGPGALDSSAVLESVDWLAIGFEIIDCPFLDWQFKPADFVAAYGLHKALIVAQPYPMEHGMIPALIDDLAGFKIKLWKNGQMVEEGAGRNSLRSPALCLAELARTTPLYEGELVSTGTLTAAQPIGSGDVWRVELNGLPLEPLTLHCIPV